MIGLWMMLQTGAGPAEPPGAPPSVEAVPIQRPAATEPAPTPDSAPPEPPPPDVVPPVESTEATDAPPPGVDPADTWAPSEPGAFDEPTPMDIGAAHQAEPIPVEPEPEPDPLPTAGTPRPLELPEHDGRGFVMGAIGTGAFAWTMSLGSMGLIGSCQDYGCVAGFVGMTGLRWAANGTALGLSIPAGIYRGRFDAVADRLDGAPPRNVQRFVTGGAVVLGVGAGGWLLTRALAVGLAERCSSEGCIYGYLASLQATWTLVSAGAGMLSYGLSYRASNRKLDKGLQVRVTPLYTRRTTGLAVAGRF